MCEEKERDRCTQNETKCSRYICFFLYCSRELTKMKLLSYRIHKNTYTHIYTHKYIYKYDTSFTYIYISTLYNIHIYIYIYYSISNVICVIGSTNHESREQGQISQQKIESKEKKGENNVVIVQRRCVVMCSKTKKKDEKIKQKGNREARQG